MAQRRGFEPPDESPPSHDFQSCSLNHSDISASERKLFYNKSAKNATSFARLSALFARRRKKKFFHAEIPAPSARCKKTAVPQGTAVFFGHYFVSGDEGALSASAGAALCASFSPASAAAGAAAAAASAALFAWRREEDSNLRTSHPRHTISNRAP